MTELLPAQTQIKEINNLFLGNVPNRMGRFMVANRDQAGRMTKNPFHFRHNNISKIAVSLEGQTVSPGVLSIDTSSKDAKHNNISKVAVSVEGQTVSPGVLSIDTSSKDAKDAYFQLVRASGKLKRVESSIIEPDDFFYIFLYEGMYVQT